MFWIKEHEGKSEQALLLDDAIVFFGLFPGAKKKLKIVIEKIKVENKKRKQKAHRSLMKQCGGGGKQGNIPPEVYVPECFANTEKCKLCRTVFYSNNDLREHAKIRHADYVMKRWSSDALSNVTQYNEYKTWLEQKNDIDIFNELEKGNDVLQKRNDIIGQCQEAYMSSFPKPQHKFVPALHFGTL